MQDEKGAAFPRARTVTHVTEEKRKPDNVLRSRFSVLILELF